MSLGYFLKLGKCLDSRKSGAEPLKPVPLRALVPRFFERRKGVPVRDENGNIVNQSEATMATEEKPTPTLKQQDNRMPGQGPQSLLGRILRAPAVQSSMGSEGEGSLLRKHVNSLRSDIGVVDLRLAPAKPLAGSEKAGAGWGSRMAGVFRSMRTLR